MYCTNCGAEVNERAVVCVKCGCAIDCGRQAAPLSSRVCSENKNEWLTVLLLCLFLGGLGMHRFYTKNNDIAVMQLILFFVSCGTVSWMWAVVDLVFLLAGSYTTGDGRVLKN